MAYATVHVPSSPTTPTRSQRRRSMRQSLSLLRSSEESSSTLTSICTDTTPPSTYHSPHSRRLSHASLHQKVCSPTSPRPGSSHSLTLTGHRHRKPSSRLSISSAVSFAPSDLGIGNNTIGNLADELDGQYTYGEPEQDDSLCDDTEEGILALGGMQEADRDMSTLIMHSPVSSAVHPFSTPVPSPTKSWHSSRTPLQPPGSISPSKQWSSLSRHKPKPESLYDGSDCGMEATDDDESEPTFTPMLQRRMHELEDIAQISTHAYYMAEAGDVVQRTTKRLKEELGDQTAVEVEISRLATGYISLDTHRTNQSREVQILAQRLMGAGGHSSYTVASSSLRNLPADLLESVIIEVELLISSLPFQLNAPAGQHPGPLTSLQQLHHSTNDLLQQLYGLEDTLIESRQVLNTASRKLRSVRELVDELAMQEELVETSILLIQAGDWDRRCRERQAGRICREVMDGARTVCHNFDFDINRVAGIDPVGPLRPPVSVAT